MGVERLDGVREKLIRADEHLQAIEGATADYIVTEEFGISTQREDHIPEKSGRSGTTWRADLKPPPPLRIAVLCGDFVHNLRSSLDHLARDLVLENEGIPNDDPGDVKGSKTLARAHDAVPVGCRGAVRHLIPAASRNVPTRARRRRRT